MGMGPFAGEPEGPDALNLVTEGWGFWYGLRGTIRPSNGRDSVGVPVLSAMLPGLGSMISSASGHFGRCSLCRPRHTAPSHPGWPLAPTPSMNRPARSK